MDYLHEPSVIAGVLKVEEGDRKDNQSNEVLEELSQMLLTLKMEIGDNELRNVGDL